ncbi:cysteine proteinase [Stemphylium lycopersici]|nr:cysteine proteinase [Stemphylium lycopersici]
MVRETELQARRRRRATGISKKWNIARRSQHPRGLPNSGNDCYRNGSIQPLVNFPRFVNWILGHNTKNGNWPCRDDNPDHSLAGEMVENEAPHNPISFPYNHPSVYLIHQLFQRYFCEDREGFSDEVKDWRKDDPLVTDAEIDRRTRAARRSCMTEQQDADELVLRLFAGIEESFDRETPDGLVLQEQFDSLFRIYTSIRRVCILCQNEEDVGFEDNIGLRIVPPQTGGDTVTGGIARTLRDTYDYHTKCEACNEDLVAERTSRFDSTPEYLRIHIALAQYGEDGVRRKIKTRIPVEETLDLSSHMANSEDLDAASALYKLHSVTYHSGSTLRSGHYVASVTGPGARKPVFQINDHHLKPLPGKTVKGRSPLTLNPLKMGGSFDAMMLWYEKVYTRDKRKTTDELTVDEGNALMKRLNHKKEGQRDDAAGAGNVSVETKGGKKPYVTQRGRLTWR